VKPYTKTYLNHFGYSVADFIPCECCGAKSVDIHHLTPRSLRKDLVNKIDNLMALCRTCHDRAGRDREFNDELRYIHRKRLLAVTKDNERIIFGP
jgi:5-methylcytosine-specific restriction endonuclease McrA